jgi:hypothetical protein
MRLSRTMDQSAEKQRAERRDVSYEEEDTCVCHMRNDIWVV